MRASVWVIPTAHLPVYRHIAIFEPDAFRKLMHEDERFCIAIDALLAKSVTLKLAQAVQVRRP